MDYKTLISAQDIIYLKVYQVIVSRQQFQSPPLFFLNPTKPTLITFTF